MKVRLRLHVEEQLFHVLRVTPSSRLRDPVDPPHILTEAQYKMWWALREGPRDWFLNSKPECWYGYTIEALLKRVRDKLPETVVTAEVKQSGGWLVTIERKAPKTVEK